MLLPFKINTLFQTTPFANLIILGVTGLVSLLALFTEAGWASNLLLDGWSPAGFFGHMLLHADLWHLVGNLIFLWVFGNAICGNTNNLLYPLLYLGFGIAAAAAHNIFDSGVALGASGAVNGIVGMATAMYPKNNVSMFYFFLYKMGTFELQLWVLSLIWLALDIYRAIGGESGIAAWAHLGGFFAGLVTGMIFLKYSIVELTKWDNESLNEILSLN